MKQLARLLFLQGDRCFFCRQSIPAGEASVEHLVATANGGAKEDENCVACCKSVNIALGHLSVKAKLQAILNHSGNFKCPMSGEPPTTSIDQPNSDRVAVVVADLQKRGAALPRRVATLKNTINAAFRMSLSEEELNVLLDHLQAAGFVTIDNTKVSYAFPSPNA